jgi:hypothetical protein
MRLLLAEARAKLQRMTKNPAIATTPEQIIETYEKAGWGVADFQARIAKSAQIEWLKPVLEAQADLTRTVVSAQASAARSIVN